MAALTAISSYRGSRGAESVATYDAATRISTDVGVPQGDSATPGIRHRRGEERN
jgi:hypothetical protein